MDPNDHSGDHYANASDDEVERIVAQGPNGAIAVAGVAAVVVLAIWIGFYFLVFLPRGVIH
ncbi:hypothetical protein [Paraburkholderia diazotrophica]|uniref:Cytochrome c oxidase subunit IIa family protein n=1 Tax=Paraburkholderia diazotrophica TaxID=667676 RepID=A0A1H6RZZ2_9BURK|nr:hypothetical protein [Paraburkholderia diazotrophica]SEI56742.1 hypothetical protein SAMN05192539_1002356 [Paraburkholderia diazotrophica]